MRAIQAGRVRSDLHAARRGKGFNVAKESHDKWGRRVLRPCPFCGGKGSQPNGKAFVNITHKPDCWILKRHEYYGGMTRVDEDDPAWNERAE